MRPSTTLPLIFAAALAGTSMAADAIWTDLPALPTPISNNAVTSVDHGDGTWSLYSFMGITDPTDTTTITRAAYRMDWPGGHWVRIADVPNFRQRPRIAANAVTVAGRVYVFGGYLVLDDGSEATNPRLWRYEPDTDSYTRLANVPISVDDTVAGVFRDRYIVLVSGWHGPANDNTPAVQLYDTQTDTWTQSTAISAPPEGLFGHVGTVVGNCIVYADGVRTVPFFRMFRRSFIGTIDPDSKGDLSTITWAQAATHPGALVYRAAGSHGATRDGRVLITGGTDNPYNIDGTGYDGQPSAPLDQLLAYSPQDDSWAMLTTAGAHPPTMDHRGLVRVGNNWATIGGMTASGIATNRVFMLTLLSERTAGDVDLDGRVDIRDLARVLTAFGHHEGQSDYDLRADLDLDGSVTNADLRALLKAFGQR